MPSDPRIEIAFKHLAPAIDRFRSTVVSAAEEVRGYLASREAGAGGGKAAVGLGQFAAGRIDYDRFAGLLTATGVEDPATLKTVEKALDILRLISAAENDLFHVRVKPGGRLREAVANRLAEIGRGFAAARVAGKATLGSLNSGSGGDQLALLSFERWNGAERKLAPPLVVEVGGADLHTGGLVEFLDGSLKIVLVVGGPAAPAPLSRLITPGTLVLQTADAVDLHRVTEAAGPAVAALMPPGAARFVHDPLGGAAPWERLTLLEVPAGKPKKPVGGISVWQQVEELAQLEALARRPGAGDVAEDAAAAAAVTESPVDKLAAWLLSQADLKNLD